MTEGSLVFCTKIKARSFLQRFLKSPSLRKKSDKDLIRFFSMVVLASLQKQSHYFS